MSLTLQLYFLFSCLVVLQNSLLIKDPNGSAISLLHKDCYIFGAVPQLDCPEIPILNELLFIGLLTNFVNHVGTLELIHVNKQDRVHLEENGNHVLNIVKQIIPRCIYLNQNT